MTKFEENIKQDLHRYLQMEGKVDARLPEAVDIEDKWFAIGQSYMPDAIREFVKYPEVTLGWMMYIGMAVAALWDKDWEHYSAIEDLYIHLRDKRGYDNLDEYIREEVLLLNDVEYKACESLVSECAMRTHANLRRASIEPGTREAFHAYVQCLHQLYLMGAAVQLKAMGYKMSKYDK